MKKLTELATWVKSDKDILIPVTKFQGQWVALDGHTRLKLAQLLNIKEVYAYEEETDAYIEDFVLFCKEQQKTPFTIFRLFQKRNMKSYGINFVKTILSF